MRKIKPDPQIKTVFTCSGVARRLLEVLPLEDGISQGMTRKQLEEAIGASFKSVNYALTHLRRTDRAHYILVTSRDIRWFRNNRVLRPSTPLR